MLRYVSTQFKDCVDSSLAKENAELKKEVAELKLQLFWSGHHYKDLQKLMTMANHTHRDLRCGCNQCHTYHMFSGEQSPGPPGCLFKPWFERQLTACGLTFSVIVEANASVFSRSGKIHKLYDVDADFVEVRYYFMGTVSYASKYIYGPKILNAKSADAEALKKLEKLFETIDKEIKENMHIP
jgi:hypothetical protein